MAERSKALDWNSSNILTGVRGFESHSLRHMLVQGRPAKASDVSKSLKHRPFHPTTRPAEAAVFQG
jgi:hypothetical protein